MTEKAHRAVTITNQRGLHARAAGKFVGLAEAYEAEITVMRKGQEVSGRSIMGLMMLAAGPGAEVEVVTHGHDAVAAVEALVGLIERRFDEDE